MDPDQTAPWEQSDQGSYCLLPRKGEHSGSVVECLTVDQGVLGLSLTGATVLCP